MMLPSRILAIIGLLAFLVPLPVRAQLLMDVFPGWDGQTIAYRWTPLVVEISNRGMPITGFIEIRNQSNLDKRISMMAVEVPSQSNKRVFLYVPPQVSYGSLIVSLLSEQQKVIKDQQVNMSKVTSSPSRLVAESIPSSWLKMGLNGQAVFPKRPGWQSTRILKQHLPDSYVGYDSLNALHLGWSDVKDLSGAQKQALVDWVWLGGHLIVSAESVDEWRTDHWWKEILPFEVSDRKENAKWSSLESWTHEMCRNFGLSEEKINFKDLESAVSLVMTGSLKNGKVLIRQDELPLVVMRRAGRGFITQVLFNPGLEPFRSWNGKEYFWECLLQIPHETMDSEISGKESDKTTVSQGNGSKKTNMLNVNTASLYSMAYDCLAIDLLSTDQQKNFPWIILTLLLMGYVILIGPLDYIWLKRRNKWIWTWVTFPTYVAVTTVLIYFLGYWTNNGVSEWKQWTVQDWFSDSSWQYHTTVSRFYSSRNSEYAFRDESGVVTQVREVTGNEFGHPTINQKSIILTPSGTRVVAEIPVWTSASYSGKYQTAGNPIEAEFDRASKKLKVKNLTSNTLNGCRWVMEADRCLLLGDLKSGEVKEWDLNELQSSESKYQNIFSLIYGLNVNGHGEIHGSPENIDLNQQFFFLPTNKGAVPLVERGSVGDGLDLTCSWQDGDAVLLATSKVTTSWPWGLNFKPERQEHVITYRFHFPAQLSDATLSYSPK